MVSSVVVDPASAAAATEVLVEAFYTDPLWAWAFPHDDLRRDQHRRLWGLAVDEALHYGWVRATPGIEAVALWIPPGGTELSEATAARFDSFVDEVAGADAGRVRDAFAAFEQAHPHDEPHYYLSLLGTAGAHRGRGLGLGLLADCLERIDAEGRAAYLESSNAGNVALYERAGFRSLRTIRVGADGPLITTMWRDPRP